MSLIIDPAPSPPSAPGITQPVTEGGPPSVFPDFTPILPPPIVGEGGGPPPDFPPPTPPPIGEVPVGPLVGPAIAATPIPPSVSGITQPVTGGKNTYVFPDFTTTWPNPPVQVTGTPPPTMLTTTELISINGWGPPGPQEPPVEPPVEPLASSNG